MGSFRRQYMFELKKYRGVKFDSTEDWCNIYLQIIDLAYKYYLN